MQKMDSFAARLRVIGGGLEGAELRAVRWLEEHSDELTQVSITEVAERSGTSEATVVRACRKLGYAGFRDFKIAAARESGRQLFYDFPEDVTKDDPPDVAVEKVFSANIKALELTREVVDSRALAEAADVIRDARQVVVFALGTSGPIALDAQYKLVWVGVNCQVILDPHIQLLTASQLSHGDVAIAISHSGRSTGTVQALAAAREAGAFTIAITASARTPITREARLVLLTAIPDARSRSGAMASRVAQMTLFDAIQVNIALHRGEAAVNRIEKIERVLRQTKM